MPSTHSPFILQHSSKPAVGNNMALIHMGSPLCSVEHTVAAVQRQKLIRLHRGLNVVKFKFFPVQSPAYLPSLPSKIVLKKKKSQKPVQTKSTHRSPRTSRGCKFQLQPGRAAADVGELAGHLAKSWQHLVRLLQQFF